ncbi:MAG TPA: alpha/beta fold hydrolase [Dongiaceae bacterium]|nr:alpha/beta fold hydrolase [Dongiaceae bacterium]
MGLIPWLVVPYAAICAVAYFGNRLFTYFPDPTRIPPAAVGLVGVEEIEIKAADGVTLVAWQAPAKGDRPVILYFHGNAANAANRAEKIERIDGSGFGIFYLNNRGYGGSGGRPTEEANIADALAAYDHLIAHGVPAERIVAYGESLGSGQAVPLAAKRRVAAVVLEAPLTSTVDVGRRVYFWLPLNWLVTDRYDNERNIRAVTAPVLILHGERDSIVPVEMGRRLYDAAKEPKRIELFSRAGHNDLFDHGAWERAEAFLESLNR